ncbi:acyltransferase [Curtobacterium sp. MCPF17_050]|uniref:acyltransferase family protein n=1 Tax=Curtobacterium sp. MCPF17_050 TaxID=2175664 RepID=UPI000D98210C|nr:acyltransferase [Curtobacterium sp. MCPF17_050]WIB16058.1 acyltransferase [Curtobacterium sp. MCPF17_050]
MIPQKGLRSTAPLNAANRFAHIDALRAFAVTLVVVAHAGLGDRVPGGSGVTIFFAISGFIITYLALNERARTGSFAIGRFYFRRAAKLAPPFFVLICVPTLIWSAFNSLDWRAFAAQILFAYNWYKVDGGAAVLPGSGVVWSLAIEEQFYVVFAILWLVLTRSPAAVRLLSAVTVVVIVASSCLRFAFALDGPGTLSHRIYYGTDTRIDAIAFGLLCAIALNWWERRGKPSDVFRRTLGSNWSLVAAIGLFGASLLIRDQVFRDSARYSLQALFACLVLLYGFLNGTSVVPRVFAAVARLRFLNEIGLASYSIYLVHLPIIYLISPHLQALDPYSRALLLAAIGIVAGVASYHVIEVPTLRMRRRLERSL